MDPKYSGDSLSERLESVKIAGSCQVPPVPPPPVPKRPPPLHKSKTPETPLHVPSVRSLGAYKKPPLLNQFYLKPPASEGVDSTEKNRSHNYKLAVYGSWIVCSLDRRLTFLGVESKTVRIVEIESAATALLGTNGQLWVGTADGQLLVFDVNLERIFEDGRAHQSIVNLSLLESVASIGPDWKVVVWDGIKFLPKKILFFPASSKGRPVCLNGCFYLLNSKKVTLISEMDMRCSFDITKHGHVNVGSVVDIVVVDEWLLVFHEDGKVSQWNKDDGSFKRLVSLGPYRITVAKLVFGMIWIGFSTGRMAVLDLSIPNSWRIFAEWKVHQSSIINLVQVGSMVVSLAEDEMIYVWDGSLASAHQFNRMRRAQSSWCRFGGEEILICSWNVGSSKPPDLGQGQFWNCWLANIENSPSMIVFGLQEVIRLESKRANARLILGNPKETRFDLWSGRLTDAIQMIYQGQVYNLIVKESLVGLYLLVFVRQDQQENVRFLSTSTVKCGLGGLHGNKGSVCVRFLFHDSSICLINCHLAAGHTKVAARNSDAGMVLKTGQFSETPSSLPEQTFTNGGDGSAIEDIEHCFFFGDLNYRIDGHRSSVLGMIEDGHLDQLVTQDQLVRQRKSSNPLDTFDEAPITFPPTYKFDPNSNQYDTGEKMRTPAWCDRILHRSCTGLDGAGIVCRDYSAVMKPVPSDHKPIRSVMSVPIRTIDQASYQRQLDQIKASIAPINISSSVPPNKLT